LLRNAKANNPTYISLTDWRTFRKGVCG